MSLSHAICLPAEVPTSAQRLRTSGREIAASSPGFLDPDASVRLLEHGVPWQVGRCHYHHGYELHLLLAPHRCAYVGGDVHRLAAGSIVLIGPRLPHNLAFVGIPGESGKQRSLTLRFADEPLRRSMEFLPELREVEGLLSLAHQGAEFHGLEGAVLERFHRIGQLRGLERFAEFAALLHALSRCRSWRALAAPDRGRVDAASAGRGGRIFDVLDFIDANYMRELPLSEVSAVAGMSPSAFSRYFRQATGSTFTEAVISLRIAKACQLLLQTRKQVASICYEVGFNNISNFNRHFQALRGVSPGRYRKNREA